MSVARARLALGECVVAGRSAEPVPGVLLPRSKRTAAVLARLLRIRLPACAPLSYRALATCRAQLGLRVDPFHPAAVAPLPRVGHLQPERPATDAVLVQDVVPEVAAPAKRHPVLGVVGEIGSRLSRLPVRSFELSVAPAAPVRAAHDGKPPSPVQLFLGRRRGQPYDVLEGHRRHKIVPKCAMSRRG